MTTKINSVSAITGTRPYETKMVARNHIVVSDEPVESGGGDLGMKAHELLLSSLAACTCITVKMYADRKAWKLEQVRAELVMERETENGVQTTRIVQELMLIGALDNEQKLRLLEIAGRCPVHKTLKPAITIETKLK
jgi:putative redox protein